MLEEKTSKNLGIPYVYLPDQKKFLCQNGVMFTLEEYHNGIDLNAEYERRERRISSMITLMRKVLGFFAKREIQIRRKKKLKNLIKMYKKNQITPKAFLEGTIQIFQTPPEHIKIMTADGSEYLVPKELMENQGLTMKYQMLDELIADKLTIPEDLDVTHLADGTPMALSRY